MSNNSSRPNKIQTLRQKRRKDFFVLVFGCAGLLTLLLFTGGISPAEWVLANLVLILGAIAYFEGSAHYHVASVEADTEPAATETANPKAYEDTVHGLINGLPFPTILINADGRLEVANAKAKEVFRLVTDNGVRASAALRQPDLLAASIRVSDTGAEEQLAFKLPNDGQSWIAQIRPGPKENTVIITLEDRTAIRRAEQVRVDFLANASHELRTPLTAISGFIETMRGPAKNDYAAWGNFLDIMFQQSERMKRLISDLLSLSRIEFSEHNVPSTTIDLSPLLVAAIDTLEQMAHEKSLKIVAENTDQSFWVVADPDEMTQVIQNLISNAIKYAADGEKVIVQIGAANTMELAESDISRGIPEAAHATLLSPQASQKAPAIWVRVVDEGSGISAQKLPRLGERFYRVDESRGGRIDGTGLGLAIVKHILARHRGGLAVESKKGVGTAFSFWLPRGNVPARHG